MKEEPHFALTKEQYIRAIRLNLKRLDTLPIEKVFYIFATMCNTIELEAQRKRAEAQKAEAKTKN